MSRPTNEFKDPLRYKSVSSMPVPWFPADDNEPEVPAAEPARCDYSCLLPADHPIEGGHMMGYEFPARLTAENAHLWSENARLRDLYAKQGEEVTELEARLADAEGELAALRAASDAIGDVYRVWDNAVEAVSEPNEAIDVCLTCGGKSVKEVTRSGLVLSSCPDCSDPERDAAWQRQKNRYLDPEQYAKARRAYLAAMPAWEEAKP